MNETLQKIQEKQETDKNMIVTMQLIHKLNLIHYLQQEQDTFKSNNLFTEYLKNSRKRT